MWDIDLEKGSSFTVDSIDTCIFPERNASTVNVSDSLLESLLFGHEVVFRILSSAEDRNITISTFETDSGESFE